MALYTVNFVLLLLLLLLCVGRTGRVVSPGYSAPSIEFFLRVGGLLKTGNEPFDVVEATIQKQLKCDQRTRTALSRKQHVEFGFVFVFCVVCVCVCVRARAD